jgi:photosystem II stability/assembly factor-like uncharacterized protein
MYKYLYIFFLACGLLGFYPSNAQYTIELVDSSQQFVSYRGLSVVNDRVVWVSGSKGTVGLSKDGGKNWKWMQIPGFEKSDFRDIEGFDKNKAIIMASGTPAVILKTTDGGKNWKVVFRDNRPEMFLDAMDFWDEKRGMLVGDPINGRFVLLETTNGGDSWKVLDSTLCPEAHDSEAVFAASGTSLRCWGENEFGFVTGGKISRFLKYYPLNPPIQLQSHVLDLVQGNSTSGAFSFTFTDVGIRVVGGDYLHDTLYGNNSQLIPFEATPVGVDLPKMIKRDVLGYRSCIEALEFDGCIACGTSGVDIYNSIALKWFNISNQSFHVVRKAKKGKAVFLAGSKGRIAKLNY